MNHEAGATDTPEEFAPLVLVEWVDSRQPVGEWRRLSEFEASEPCSCVSVGFLISDRKEAKVLAPNMADIDDEDMQASGLITIPDACITRVVKLIEDD